MANILDSPGRMSQFKSSTGTKINSSKRKSNSWERNIELRKDIKEALELYKDELDVVIYNYLKGTIGRGDIEPKNETESWVEYFNRQSLLQNKYKR